VPLLNEVDALEDDDVVELNNWVVLSLLSESYKDCNIIFCPYPVVLTPIETHIFLTYRSVINGQESLV